MWWTLAAAALAAEPYVAVEWRPLGRADLTWVQEDRTSGLLVGSLDGFSRPQAQIDGGLWLSRRFALQASLGVARMQTTTWVGDVYTQQHWGVVRPGLDGKMRLADPPAHLPQPWLLAGVHLDVPSARDVSNGYDDEQQVTADEVATADRMRLGAWGARAGVGVEQRLVGGLSIGAQYTLQWQRSLFVDTDPRTITSLTTGEAALLLLFDWPGDPDAPGDDT